MKIRTWPKFARKIRPRGNLLTQLDEFPDSILVSGCQRSGGTMLAKCISGHSQMTDFAWSRDAELDGALLLSGYAKLPPKGRYCFQTTYLNEQYCEYDKISEPFKLIWLVRNPISVVYSMVHNWRRFALNELFQSCGDELLNGVDRTRYNRWGVLGVKPVSRACLAYNGKVNQLRELSAKLPESSMMVLEYETLVADKHAALAAICSFTQLDLEDGFGATINTASLNKAERISPDERELVTHLCSDAYMQARARVTSLA